MSSVLAIVSHYQRSIEKANNDENRLLHCIGKLYHLPVTVQHLQETGVGRTVNFLRKFEGEVGVAAKALVTKWKAMVAADESSDGGGDGANDEPQNNEDDDNLPNESNVPIPHYKKDSKADDHQHSRPREPSDRNEKHEKERQHSRDKHSHETTKKSSNESRHSSKAMKYNGENSHHHYHSKHSNDRTSDKRLSQESSNASHVASLSSDMKSNSHHSSSKSSHSSSKDRKRHRSSSSDSEKELQIDIKIKKEEPVSDSDTTNELYIDSDHSHQERKSKEKSHSDRSSSDGHNKSKKEHKSHHLKPSTSSSRDRDENKSKSYKEESSVKNKSSTSSSSSSHHHHHSRSSDYKKSSTNSSSSSNHKSRHKEENSKKIKNEPGTSTSSRSNTTSSSKHSRVDDTKINKSSKKPKTEKFDSDDSVNEDDNDGIDCSTGASFADVLAMIPSSNTTSTAKSSTKKKIVTSSKTQSKQLNTPTSSSLLPSSSASSSSKNSDKSKAASLSLLAPSAKLEPLVDPEIIANGVMDAPTISNNYKPMPLNQTVMECVFASSNKSSSSSLQRPIKLMTDEEAFGSSIQSKNLRTKVYSGIKSGQLMQVPSLHELCIRVLQRNIDALEYTGGVPFDILKPILERATPQQLFTFEHYNPYLIDDSDHLWQHHCNRHFRGQKRFEMETWREMYMRCQDEQEARLTSLTENIKQSQVASVPLKQTKLAYVDSMVKPPRNIARKQFQYGTERKLVATPAARVASLSNLSTNITKVGDTRLKVAPGLRDTAQAGAFIKPRKAPLMQKTLMLMKGRFKR